MKSKITIYFDLDGTIYNLYGMTDWKNKLDTGADNVFNQIDNTLVDMKKLSNICEFMQNSGLFDFGIISWLPKNATEEQKNKYSNEKQDFINSEMLFVNKVCLLPYGTPKHSVISRNSNSILFDDDITVRISWKTAKRRKAFDVNNIFEDLFKIFMEEMIKDRK